MKALKTEQILKGLFALLVLIRVIMVLAPVAFITHDGPAHLYNAHILGELLFNPESIYHTDHVVNLHFLQPNLTGHFLLLLFQWMVPALWAEKLVIALYVFLFAYGFKYWLSAYPKHHANWYAFLALPFVFNIVVFWGFLSFNLGLALLFWFIGMYERRKDGNHWLLLSFFALFLFYTHALILVFALMYIGIERLITLWPQWRTKQFSIRRLQLAFYTGLPSGVLFLLYLLGQEEQQTEGQIEYVFMSRVLRLVKNIEALSFAGYAEGTFVITLYVLMLVLLVMLIWEKRKQLRVGIQGILAMLFLALFFCFPEAGAGGSIIIVRLNLVFFLFFMVYLATGSLNKWRKGVIILMIIVQIPLLISRQQLIQSGALQVSELLKLSEVAIPEESAVLTTHDKTPEHYHGGYQIHTQMDLLSNIDLYAACQQNLVSLHNYEANQLLELGYFPVRFREKRAVSFSNVDMGNGRSFEFIQPDTLQKYGMPMPAYCLSVGAGSVIEANKLQWDPNQLFLESAEDDIGLFRVYRNVSVTP